MKSIVPLAAVLAFLGCGPTPAHQPAPAERPVQAGQPSAPARPTLRESRRAFTTRLSRQERSGEPVAEPPASVLRSTSYPTALGEMAAYITPDPHDGSRHPAILWIVGGFDFSIGDEAWTPAPADNDQSASVFRENGVVTMYASLRGGNQNPGVHEGLLGEVDDLISAAEFLSAQTYVDPHRVYLGGHSTGGTLALLTAECTDRFRAVFAFGPIEDIRRYGTNLPFDTSDARESALRSPGKWLDDIKSPVFVFEGSEGNIHALRAMARSNVNPAIHFFEIAGGTHFNVLRPTSLLVAQKILADTGRQPGIDFTGDEIAAAQR